MSDPVGDLSPLGARVRDADPDRFEAALFAEPAIRERLFTLYAYDLELRTVWRKVSEPQLGAIRLQFWIDAAREAAGGASPRAHEIAEPLHGLVSQAGADAERLADMAHARLRDLDARAEDDIGVFFGHLDASEGAAMRVAGALCAGPTSDAADRALGDLGFAMGVARALEAAPALAAQGRISLPLADAEAAALSEGRTTEHMSQLFAAFAQTALDRLAAAQARKATPRAALPATLAAWRAPRVLKRVAKGISTLDDLGPESPARRRTSLLWRAARGW